MKYFHESSDRVNNYRSKSDDITQVPGDRAHASFKWRPHFTEKRASICALSSVADRRLVPLKRHVWTPKSWCSFPHWNLIQLTPGNDVHWTLYTLHKWRRFSFALMTGWNFFQENGSIAKDIFQVFTSAELSKSWPGIWVALWSRHTPQRHENWSS